MALSVRPEIRQQVNNSTSAFLVVTLTWKYLEKLENLVTRVNPSLLSGPPSPRVSRVSADSCDCRFCDKSCFSTSVAIFTTAIPDCWRLDKDERTMTFNGQVSEMGRIMLIIYHCPKSCISNFFFWIYVPDSEVGR